VQGFTLSAMTPTTSPPAPAPTHPGSLAGLAEIAELAGVSRQRALQLANHPKFPRPRDELRSGRVWDRRKVAEHLERTRGPRADPS
jgi:hypothetical protein